MTRIGDPSFGLDRYALPLLSILSTLEPDFADFDEGAQVYDVTLQTGLHRVGDKHWVELVLFPQLDATGPRKRLAFGRDAYADEIVVESWQTTQAETEAGDDETPSALRRFAPKDIMAAAAFIRSELAESYRALRAARPELDVLSEFDKAREQLRTDGVKIRASEWLSELDE